MKPNKIVIHHTLANTDESVNSHYKNVSKWQSLSDLWSFIPYHFTIYKDGTVKQHRKLSERSWATRENNRSINIWLHGNFDQETPTEEQLESAKNLIAEIRSIYWQLDVYEHWDLEGEHTKCAGKNFDISMIWEGTKDNKETDATLLWSFSMTYYYAPEPPEKQWRYEKWHTVEWDIQKSYEWSKNVNCWPWDCLQPAYGSKYTEEDIGKVVACDSSLARKKLYIEWYGEVTCRDVWWSIKWKKLDLWAGIGIEWLRNVEGNKLGKPQVANVYILN